MIKINNKASCTGCYACETVCKAGAITLIKDDEGFGYPVVDEQKCKKCKLCIKVCPIQNQNGSNSIQESYATFNKDNEVRRSSSSGGIFTYLSKQILEDGGVVFGAAFDDDYNVHHIYVETESELSRIRTSKYLQSQIKDSYTKAKEFLDSGRKVLFSGTPCQIAGLKKSLRKNYDNLYTQDFICHGVPSPKVWQKYLSTVNTENKEIKKINFRSKRNGWKDFGLEITYDDSSEYFCVFKENVYSKAFLCNLCLRPSCYKCVFKNKNPFSDITLADYWGVDVVNPQIDDNEGISAVMINSEKGKHLFFDMADDLFVEKIELDDKMIQYNPALIKQSYKHKKRDYFMRKLDEKPFDELVEQCTKQRKTPVVISLTRRAINKAKRMFVKKFVKK